MNRSDSIAAIAPALVKAQRNIGSAVKGAKNPFFKSKYAELGSIMEACKEPLLAQGICVLQMPGRDEHGPYLDTILLHESGEWISEKMSIICAKPHDPQALGSAVTYDRRYALQAALFIPAVDDDGEAAATHSRALQKQDEAIEERETRREREARQVGHEEPTAFEEVKRVMNGDWRNAIVPFGKNKGKQLGELTDRQLDWYAGEWLDSKRGKPVRAADGLLMDALEAYKAQRPGKSAYDQAGEILENNRVAAEEEVIPF